VFGSTQQTPIFYNGYIYGVRPDGQLVCLDINGNIIWASTNNEKFGLGPYIIINDLIYVLDDVGVLSLAEAGPRSFVKLAEAKVLEGHDSWGPMAVAGRRLILRDMNRMICVDIGE
jgi:outer membrane protein assembly factor BamB